MNTSKVSPPHLTRCSSQELLRTPQSQKAPSPTPLRSNSFVSSRRCGIVSEQDVMRLAAVTVFDDDRNHRQPATTTAVQTNPSPWPAPAYRHRSSDCRPRPLSTGYLLEAQANHRVQGQGSPAVRADTVDPQLRLQNVALLPNRQLIQQPDTRAENRWHQWNNTSQRKGRSFGDVSPLATENGWLPTTRSSGAYQQSSRPNDQQLLAEREAELRAIRWTMEKNEAAILQAMEDQRRASEATVAAERESWECRLSDAERRIDDVRQTLTERIHDLERDNAALEHENAALLLSSVERAPQHNRTTVHRNEHLVTTRNQHSDDEELDDRGSFKELLVNGVDGRSHATRNFSSASSTSTASTRSSADQRRPPLTHVNSDSAGIDASASRLPAIPEGPVTRCHHCEVLSNELERVKQEFDAERQQWLAEKRRVIEYQKLLQSKYIQLERRYAALERWTPADKLSRVESVDGATAGSHPLRGAWNSAQAQSSLLFPRLIPFGQSIET